MRIWDLSPKVLCRSHLLGEHAELHALWSILTEGKRGYARHPETLRWKGKLMALYLRHELLVQEMEARHYHHQSPLNQGLANGSALQDEYVDSIEAQRQILLNKKCGCKVQR
jgi:hypothetical protein